MGLKTFTIRFTDLKSNNSIRLSKPFVLPESKFKYENIIKYLLVCESGSRPKGGIQNEDEGKAISLGGEQIGIDGEINLNKIPYVSFDYYEKTDKGKVLDKDILICKDGALTGKSCLVEFALFPSKKVMINEHVYILRGNENINQKFLFYFTTTSVFQSQIKDLAYKKKAQPGLNTDHIKKIQIPFINKKNQNKIIDKIETYEKNIKKIKIQIKQPQEVINNVFLREFGFNLDRINKIEQTKIFSITNNISFHNRNLRTSVRWHKIEPIQKEMYGNIQCVEKLGKYIISTKNGWSPNCRESDSNICVFGVNSISKDSYLKYIDLKYSNESKKNIYEYYVQENDLFVSRGNTVDLVALASVVKNIPEDRNFIFPDLFIKVNLDERYILREYLAHLINSIIGRLYFKYSAKGKNQTMVKISSEELNNFYLPVPHLKVQTKIIDEIKKELGRQEEYKNQIKSNKMKITGIIEKAIR